MPLGTLTPILHKLAGSPDSRHSMCCLEERLGTPIDSAREFGDVEGFLRLSAAQQEAYNKGKQRHPSTCKARLQLFKSCCALILPIAAHGGWTRAAPGCTPRSAARGRQGPCVLDPRMLPHLPLTRSFKPEPFRQGPGGLALQN